MENWEKLLKERDDYLNQVHENVNSYFKRGEAYIWTRLLQDVFPILQTNADGRISQKTNIASIRRMIVNIFKDFKNKFFWSRKELRAQNILPYGSISRIYANELPRIRQLTYIFSLFDGLDEKNRLFYREITKDSAEIIDTALMSANRTIDNTLGITRKEKGVVDAKARSQIRAIIEASQMQTVVEKTVAQYAMAETPLSQLTDKLDLAVTGGVNTLPIESQISGGIGKEYGDLTYNSNRSKMYAVQDAVGLNEFYLYAGTKLLSRTRPKCHQMAGKIWTLKELEDRLVKVNFKGKPKKGYDMFSSLGVGGYNCRHSLQAVSRTIAESKRPELKR